jgi:hypothetical protein
MLTTSMTNGQIRKSLASQLDRLDKILDGLADGLNEAVVTAVKAAVGAAVQQVVQGVLTEVLTNPELQQHLRAAPTTGDDAVPTASTLGQKVRSWWNKGRNAVTSAAAMAVRNVRRVCSGAARVIRRCWSVARNRVGNCLAGMRAIASLVMHFRRPLLIATGVGVLLGLGCYLSGPVVASSVSGAAGFTGSLVASGLNALRRMINLPDPRSA